jgi:sterol desaturase/sphingolipid hydroxylase (fatty acid hydroxylase superfamily)
MWKASPIFLAVILLEIFLSNYHHKKVYTWKETAANFYFSILNGGIDLLIRGLYLVLLTYTFSFRFIEISNPFLYWMLLVIVLDFLFYWLHRMEHYCRLFWAVHVTHHSCELINFTVGFRSSVFQPLYRFIFFIPLTFLGFRPLDIVFLYSLSQFWAIFVHTEFIGKLGWFETIFVTPSHHRVHHASNVLYLDKNMGMFLIIWDKMFGTFEKERSAEEYEPIKYGLTKPLEKENPVTIIFHEWADIWKDLKRKDLPWSIKLKYLFKPPGWSHDGSRLTSDQLRKQRNSLESKV